MTKKELLKDASKVIYCDDYGTQYEAYRREGIEKMLDKWGEEVFKAARTYLPPSDFDNTPPMFNSYQDFLKQAM